MGRRLAHFLFGPCRYYNLFALDLCARPQKFQNIKFLPWGYGNIWIDMAQPIWALEYSKCHFMSNWPKCPWLTLGWPKVKAGQNHLKTIFFMFLHQTQAIRYFCKLWLSLTPRGLKTLILIQPSKQVESWDQHHCKDYWISFPMTIHESKLELKRFRYAENRAKHARSLLEAITFDLFVVISISLVFWKDQLNLIPGGPSKRPPKPKGHLFSIKTLDPP